MYIVNIEKALLIDHIEIPVLIVANENSDKLHKILIGNEINDASMEEITVLRKEVQEWLDANIKGTYKLIRADIHFENEEEAIHFKTVWI